MVHHEIVVLFFDEHSEQILDSETVGHEFGRSQHETRRHDKVEQRVNNNRRGFEHFGGGESKKKKNRNETNNCPLVKIWSAVGRYNVRNN